MEVRGRVRPSRSRALYLSVAAAAVAGLVLPPAGVATAQAPDVAAHLVAQSAWNAPDKPLRMTVSVSNRTETAFEDLSVALTIEAPTRRGRPTRSRFWRRPRAPSSRSPQIARARWAREGPGAFRSSSLSTR